MTRSRLSSGLFCISAALLGYELLLMRLLSLAYWGHFAAFMISVALLGLSAAGLFLHFCRQRVMAHPARFFSTSAALFGLTAPLAFGVSQLLPFAPFLLAWSVTEYAHLALRVLLFFVPFFCAGVAIGTPFVARTAPVGRLYFWNMLGSAVPCAPLLPALSVTHPLRLLIPISALGWVACGLTATNRRARFAAVAAGAVMGLALTQLPFRFSEYKDLSKTLLLPQARIIAERYEPDGVVHRVVSPHTRYLPGLSLNFTGELPRSQLLFVDGSAMEVVFDAADSLARPEFLQLSPEAFSYRLRTKPRVLLLAGGPAEWLRAVAVGAERVVAVDPLYQRVTAVGDIWKRFGSSPLERGGGAQVVDDPRHYLDTSREPFDVILVSQLGSHGVATAGAASLDATYLFTVEALQSALARLSPDGHLVLTTWIENPPRAGVRLAALVVETLRRNGVRDPGNHILAMRSWSTLTFFVARQPFGAEAVAALKQFAGEHSFDLVHYPGITAADANRMNVIPDEPYFAALQALLGAEAEEFSRQSPFNVAAPTDDRPFFSHFFRWTALPHLVRTMGRDWVPFVEWGYLLLVASLVVAAVLGGLLLVLPCALVPARPRAQTVLVFFALGVAFIVVEMWAIYRLTFLFGRPMLATAMALTVMLACSGAGAVALMRTQLSQKSQWLNLAGLLIVLALAVALFPPVGAWIFGAPLGWRVAVATLWIGAPAFLMGFPFPFALHRLNRAEEIPWALAMNGFGSVLGSLLATLLAVHLGLNALGLVALGLYVAVALLLPTRAVSSAH